MPHCGNFVSVLHLGGTLSRSTLNFVPQFCKLLAKQSAARVQFENICLTKTTATQNEDALSYHRVRGLYFTAVFL